MLTSKQQKWINHLSDTNIIEVVPYDPTCKDKFEQLKQKIHNHFDPSIPVEHHGASSLGISGQDEIDVYIPVVPEQFDHHVELIKTLFGEPRSHYPLERARFVTEIDGKHIDVFVINQEDEGWKTNVKFKSYLLSHPETLDEYRKLKEEASGLSVREYYRRKVEFINDIVAR